MGGPALGTMDVKMLPNDPHGYGYVSGMFDGHIYLIDPIAGTGVAAFDYSTVTPHVDTPVTGGMGQILATPQSGDRLIFGLFMAGQVGMLGHHGPRQPEAVVGGQFRSERRTAQPDVEQRRRPTGGLRLLPQRRRRGHHSL